MKVKRYVVDTMPDALLQIRSDLGKDAVILNTKEIRVGGILGLFSKKKIEVMAAVDETERTAPAASASRQQAGEELLAQLTQAMSSLAAAKAPGVGQPPAPDSAAINPSPAPPVERTEVRQPKPLAPRFPEARYAAATGRQELAAAAAEPRPSSTPEDVLRPAAKQPEEQELLLKEIRQMKEMMSRLSVSSHTASSDEPEQWSRLRERLALQEVEPGLAEELLGELRQEMETEASDWDETELLRRARRRIVRTLEGSGVEPIRPDSRIVHFVGPTGVGKTTTIAKLAAEQVLKHKRKVGFITSDTYRIAAVEQLKTYAGILNIPLEVVFSPQDLQKAFDRLSGCEVLFMDTAGRNFRNELFVSELNSLLGTGENAETYLVMSLTAKYRDMLVITEHFRKFRLDKLLFTKLDETDSYGSVYNLTRQFGLPLSYLANGQNVPDDIELADPRRLAALLLGDDAHA
ncbi:flagellar biosynthesis protein FlhF [Paenibacillus sp. J31TS4]|uniref:flagellar biosynthesis protein FlhF n=1 Tax=Paenibacillus sp. J31TS4 TaxID=2807195 RepID=UPI001B0399E0|nr:flagellar biosynthesis protein FlhF [Paenibacillus sp. J31TS4]GIP36829.1 flagellar biosynthesis protein FlhF [Paenibacillus sp. J31TS4]